MATKKKAPQTGPGREGQEQERQADEQGLTPVKGEVKENFEVLAGSVLSEMAAYAQWVIWKKGKVKKNGKFPKVPYSPKTKRKITGTHESGEYLKKAGTFDEALAVKKELGADGLGFVLSKDDPFVGVDVDGCLGNGGDPGELVEILERFDSYSEISPSGKGIRTFCKGKLPPGAVCNPSGTPYEIYDCNKFLTVTGNVYGELKPIREAQEAVQWYCQNKAGIRQIQDKPNADKPDKSLQEIAKDLERAKQASKYIPADDYQVWLDVGFAFHSTGAGEWAYLAWDEWSKSSAKYDEADQLKTWQSFRGHENGITLGTLFETAKQHGWNKDQGEKAKTLDLSTALIEAENFTSVSIPPKISFFFPWLTSHQIILISAWRNLGKTMFAMSLLDSITKGQNFGPWECQYSSPCLYLDGEMVADDVIDRLHGFGLGNRWSKLWIFSDYYANILGLPRANLLNPKWRAAMQKLLIENEIKLDYLMSAGLATVL